ncbi:MAG TPA: isocitrate/isopropylmalate family dehydrogenase [bacterium]|nr:isocitrate/isopropylmalate family dehydrogenase [bacterium]HPJ71602.1 isocitrate/isopropylmalate family dehydrogenase [bacterium]HPQ66331.1 isocitrate/isopropylmalate family dehydrogenase [bacterium]
MNGPEETAAALEHFRVLIEEQLARVERLRQGGAWTDYASLSPLKIAVVGGDGIGPIICREAQRVLERLLAPALAEGRIEFRVVEGMTIENRAREGKAIPDGVLAEIKECPILLKGPTTTPRKGDPWPNIESANVALRRELDLFANVRPVRVPAEDIDWIFFRENTEGAYILGSRGLNIGGDLTLDFKAITRQGSERIARLAFEHARANGIPRVTAVTKANVIKTTDGLFLDTFYRVARDYPEIAADDWYVDIITAKLIDPQRRTQFRSFVLPNLYGDIVTDEAAQMQGGVGTAGSANIGWNYAMFEAIHGSAPRMVREGRGEYADPFSMIRASAMLLSHIGYVEQARDLEAALDICGQYEKKLEITGRPGGATAARMTDYLLETLADPDLLARREEYRRQ